MVFHAARRRALCICIAQIFVGGLLTDAGKHWLWCSVNDEATAVLLGHVFCDWFIGVGNTFVAGECAWGTASLHSLLGTDVVLDVEIPQRNRMAISDEALDSVCWIWRDSIVGAVPFLDGYRRFVLSRVVTQTNVDAKWSGGGRIETKWQQASVVSLAACPTVWVGWSVVRWVFLRNGCAGVFCLFTVSDRAGSYRVILVCRIVDAGVFFLFGPILCTGQQCDDRVCGVADLLGLSKSNAWMVGHIDGICGGDEIHLFWCRGGDLDDGQGFIPTKSDRGGDCIVRCRGVVAAELVGRPSSLLSLRGLGIGNAFCFSREIWIGSRLAGHVVAALERHHERRSRSISIFGSAVSSLFVCRSIRTMDWVSSSGGKATVVHFVGGWRFLGFGATLDTSFVSDDGHTGFWTGHFNELVPERASHGKSFGLWIGRISKLESLC